LIYLAAAGVGTIGIIDDDQVSRSNLQRQVVHGTADIGRPKADSAADAIARLNPHVAVEPVVARLDADNAVEIVSRFDIVADGTDNFATRYLVNDACFFAERPLVSAAVGQFDGYLTVFRAFARDDQGQRLPNYRCLFPEPPPRDMAPACEEAGILGVVTGVVGALQAAEVIKLITGVGDPLVGRLLTYDARAASFHEMRYGWDPDNPLTGTAATIRDLSVHR
jgi:adenylyltransferase/sulfurtransferase